MRVVLDTNTVVSGLLWTSAPHQVLLAARREDIQLFTTVVLLAELEDVLTRPKLARRLEQAEVASHDLVLGYAALANIIEPTVIEPVVLEDRDDDAILACAAAAHAEAIVSGDSHLLRLKEYSGIPILTAVELLQRIQASE